VKVENSVEDKMTVNVAAAFDFCKIKEAVTIRQAKQMVKSQKTQICIYMAIVLEIFKNNKDTILQPSRI